ncbi:glycosyltransferase [Arenibaculum pallidiluteum]|uniref:glycosyltransferase n=1 Tax=Arenibaculum pallidiluteum TaxID=2812559 RepID=UPI001A9717E6|nr:glycosyltransferase [Arenibaculum pallidiluteum]
MRVLFVHRSLPGHYRHVAPALAADPANRVVFATHEPGVLPGAEIRTFSPHRTVSAQIHPYVQPYEDAVLYGQAVYRLCRRLRADGFVPDLVCSHAGFGPGLYLKEAFPDAPLLTYFEWFYRARGADADFLDGPLHPDDACRIQSRNAGILQELAASDWGICPTAFQRDQFPAGFRDKMTLLHDGIDTERYAPEPTGPGTPMVLPGLDLSAAPEIVTYATRGMEPYRGFPQFMRAAALLLERRPNLRIVVGGTDQVVYSRRPAGGSYREAALRELAGRDLSRLHFVGALDEPHWLRLLRASTVHVYLTVPFVLSWSLLEAMATGCAVVASDTTPVREVAEDGREALLADFHSPEAIAGRVEEALDDAALRASLGAAARQRVLDHYALADLLPRHLRLMQNLAASADTGQADEIYNENRADQEVKASA